MDAETKNLVEQESFHEIKKPGALLLVKAAKEMGKTSLLTRIQDDAKQQGYQSIDIDFSLADDDTFNNISQFLRWFCSTITSELGLSDNVKDFWRATSKSKFSDKQICTKYLKIHLLQHIKSPILLGLDEADIAFRNFNVAREFFSLLKAWYEQARKGDECWKRLRLVINYISEQHYKLDFHQHTFNVGRTIVLPEFTQEEIQQLAQRHNLPWGVGEINQLTAMIGGHPHLVRRALYRIADQKLNLSDFLKTVATQQGLYSANLSIKIKILSESESLFSSFKQVIISNDPVDVDPGHEFMLLKMGLVKFHGNTRSIVPLCNLYRIYFRSYHFGNS